MISIDILDANGNFVAMDMKFRLEEENIAKSFLYDGFGAVVTAEIKTPNGKHWVAKMGRS